MESRTDSTQTYTEATLQKFDGQLTITAYAWAKLMAYCQATDNEVSGFMLLEKDDDQFLVTDCYLVEQESTPTSTEMQSTGIAQLFERLRKEGILGKDENVKVGHFHTHPTFNVFWSSTDMEMRRTLSRGTDYYVSLVLNQKGEALAALDINGEFPLSISNLPIEVLPYDAKLQAACALEVKEKVKKYEYRHAELPSDALRGASRGRASVGKDGFLDFSNRDYLQQQLEIDAERYGLTGADLLPDMLPPGETYTDETGTWQNVAGEIVRIRS